MNAHEVFVDRVRCMIVIPRRNQKRALDAIKEGRLKDASALLRETQRMIHDLERVVAAEDERTICQCSTCGDSHYQRAPLFIVDALLAHRLVPDPSPRGDDPPKENT